MRQTLALVIGKGIDRATGSAAVQPDTPVDAQNVYARDAKMALRPGMSGTAYDDLPWGTDILAIQPVRATGDLLFCVFDRVSRQLRIFRLRVSSGVMQPLNSPSNGIWGTLDDGADFPVVLADEADGLVFFAHADTQIIYRLPTIYYTPDFDVAANPGTLTTLMADMDSDGIEAPVYFTGVIHYLEYMVGWGYGSEEEGNLNRGDVLRLSKPGEPTVFLPENYALCGAPKDHIISCIPTEDILAIGKGEESYRLVGTSPDDFGIEILDSAYGVVSARGSVNIGGVGYWWAVDGPRRVQHAGTTPIGQALELISPLPAEFPTLGPDRLMFTSYDRRRYLLEWLFPNIEEAAARTPGFMLSNWNPSDPRWTLVVREQALACSGVLLVLAPELQPPPLTGFASDVAAADVAIAADARYRAVRVDWNNNDYDGDETVQIFANGGTGWFLLTSVPLAGTAQFVTVSTLLPVTGYDIAIRYIRNFVTGAGYEPDDPDDWSGPTEAGAKVSFETTSATVAWVSGAFVNASTPVSLSWASAQLQAPYLLEKDAGAGFVTVAADLVATSYQYTIPPAELGTTVTFRLTAQRGLVVGPTAGTLPVPMFITVGQPAWVSAVWSAVTGVAALTWSAASGATSYLLEKTLNGGGSWSPVATVAGTTYNYSPAGEINTLVGFRVTGKNGATSGTPSTTQNVTFTVTLGVAVVSSVVYNAAGACTGGCLTVTGAISGGSSASLMAVETSADGVTWAAYTWFNPSVVISRIWFEPPPGVTPPPYGARTSYVRLREYWQAGANNAYGAYSAAFPIALPAYP